MSLKTYFCYLRKNPIDTRTGGFPVSELARNTSNEVQISNVMLTGWCRSFATRHTACISLSAKCALVSEAVRVDINMKSLNFVFDEFIMFFSLHLSG